MSEKETIQKYYSNHRFSEKDYKSLKTFQTVNLLTISLDLLKNNLTKGFVFPYLWQVLVSVASVFAISLLALFLFLSSGFANSGFNDFYLQDEMKLIEEFTKLGIYFLVLIIPLVVISGLASYYLQVRHYRLLNNKDVDGIWKIPSVEINQNFFKAVIANIITGLGSLVSAIIPLYFMGLGFLNIFSQSFRNEEFSPEVRDFYSQFEFLNNYNGGGVGRGILLILISSIALVILQFLITAFFGLVEQLLVHEDLEITDSFKLSFEISKKYFWQNLARWCLFIVVLFGINIAVSIAGYIIQIPFSLLDMLLFDGNPVFSIISSLLNFVLNILSSFGITAYSLAFYYTAFYNIRMTYLSEGITEIEKTEIENISENNSVENVTTSEKTEVKNLE